MTGDDGLTCMMCWFILTLMLQMISKWISNKAAAAQSIGTWLDIWSGLVCVQVWIKLDGSCREAPPFSKLCWCALDKAPTPKTCRDTNLVAASPRSGRLCIYQSMCVCGMIFKIQFTGTNFNIHRGDTWLEWSADQCSDYQLINLLLFNIYWWVHHTSHTKNPDYPFHNILLFQCIFNKFIKILSDTQQTKTQVNPHETFAAPLFGCNVVFLIGLFSLFVARVVFCFLTEKQELTKMYKLIFNKG